ncbi:S-adenosyl-L-methionine-dependent methyltransferase [Aspergillus pseudodeflectus]|uniref:S-adenosyl-L-methionine-dependent methyltransferase n=1 Tax=Aspergillus pseudodeflectus TaxID=176178 RepID=A0ABR4KUY0_9EURO
MSINAEALFNHLGERYEAAYGNSPNLDATIEAVLKLLPDQSTVLDVGCGTGKPVSHMVAEAGHRVHGIDISERMVEIARRQVPSGTFGRADMRMYNPPHLRSLDSQPKPGADCTTVGFDAVFAVYSLYQITPGDTHAMVFRFAEWLKRGTGMLVLGVTPAESVPPGMGVEDATWGFVRCSAKTWMTQMTDEVFLSMDGWRALLRGAGLSIESERFFTFRPQDPEHNMPEDHWLLVARRTDEPALLGPHPYPHLGEGTQPERRGLDTGARREFSGRVKRDELEKIVGELVGDSQHALEISNGQGGDLTKYPDSSFETVIGTWILEHVSGVTRTVQELIRITDQSAPRSRIMLLQGAPWNEVLRFQNATCTPLAAKGQAPSHQGYLLDAAIKILSRHGFDRVTLREVNVACLFPEEDMEERCSRAAEILADLWYSDDANKERMRQALVPQLRMHFRSKPCEIGFDIVLLVAEPSGDHL